MGDWVCFADLHFKFLYKLRGFIFFNFKEMLKMQRTKRS